MKNNLLVVLGMTLVLIIGSELLSLSAFGSIFNADGVCQTQPSCKPHKDKNCH